jgi:hypothetical protein
MTMLSHDLICQAVQVVAGARAAVGITLLQRQIHVWAGTAMQLLEALEVIGVVGHSTCARKPVQITAFDRAAVLAAIQRAVCAGRLELSCQPCRCSVVRS